MCAVNGLTAVRTAAAKLVTQNVIEPYKISFCAFRFYHTIKLHFVV